MPPEGSVGYDAPMAEDPRPSPTPGELLRATRPWWILPILLILGAAVALALADGSPLRNLAYSVQ